MFDTKIISTMISNCDDTIEALEKKLTNDISKKLAGKYFINDESVFAIWGTKKDIDFFEGKIFQISKITFYDGHEISLCVNFDGEELQFDCDLDTVKIADSEEELKGML